MAILASWIVVMAMQNPAARIVGVISQTVERFRYIVVEYYFEAAQMKVL
jgi:hypothetical protein